MTTPSIMGLEDRCCGCGACEAGCPTGAVSERLDGAGFRYVSIDQEKCTHCGRCDNICPVVSKGDLDKDLGAFWAIAKDDDLLAHSSSGGVFGLLAKRVLEYGGVVYGAAFDESIEKVGHTRVENFLELDSVMRSKYVQSEINDEVYRKTKEDLKGNRRVLYSGTACQIAALRNYLGKLANSPELLCVDVICHGVPSPELWRRWITYCEDRVHSRMISANFRDKVSGWQNYSLTLSFESGRCLSMPYSSNWYMKAFLSNASLRPVCFDCPSKRACGSDITLGDFWGASDFLPEVKSSRGISAVICNTTQGLEAFNCILSQVDSGEVAVEAIKRGNPALMKSVEPHPDHNSFMSDVRSGVDIAEMQRKWRFDPGILRKIRHKLKGLKKSFVKTLS